MNLEKLAEMLMPDQGEQQIQMAPLQSYVTDDQELQQTINNELVQSLKQISDLYVKQKRILVEYRQGGAFLTMR